MNNKPLVSAIIPTKNRADLLPRAIESVLRQSYTNLELVIIDDGSTDRTPEVVEDLRTSTPIKYIRNEESMGAPYARNWGIEAASGVFVAGLDDDDEWHEERITELVKAYREEFSCMTSNVKIVYRKGSAIWNKKKIITLQDLLMSNQVGNQVLVEKARLEEVGGFDESLKAAQDYDLWVRLAERFGPVKNVQKPLQNVYVNHEGEQITNPRNQLEGYLNFYKKHKHKMNRKQRKYQLFNIRRAQGKASGLMDILGWIPIERYPKDIKRWVTEKF